MWSQFRWFLTVSIFVGLYAQSNEIVCSVLIMVPLRVQVALSAWPMPMLLQMSESQSSMHIFWWKALTCFTPDWLCRTRLHSQALMYYFHCRRPIRHSAPAISWSPAGSSLEAALLRTLPAKWSECHDSVTPCSVGFVSLPTARYCSVFLCAVIRSPCSIDPDAERGSGSYSIACARHGLTPSSTPKSAWIEAHSSGPWPSNRIEHHEPVLMNHALIIISFSWAFWDWSIIACDKRFQYQFECNF